MKRYVAVIGLLLTGIGARSADAAAFPLSVKVNTTSAVVGSTVTVTVHSAPGAKCQIDIIDTDKLWANLAPSSQKVTSSGTVHWHWTVRAHSATVAEVLASCQMKGQVRQAAAHFAIRDH